MAQPKASHSRHRIEASFWVPVDIDTVWDFASRPTNLAKISPSEWQVRVSHNGPAYEGAEFEIQLKPPFSPITIRWGSRIENVVPSGDERSFEDLQLYGPFSYWRHTHSFSKGTRDVVAPDGTTLRSLTPGTWIKDQVEYALPMGLLGDVVEKLVVSRLLRNMFRDRKHAILAMLDTLATSAATTSTKETI
ncbi:MAG TPA: SRPBCC family protein [Bdellovibrionota bacterium]|jgi:ligand-binding SRPBCC domain-containing protein|nr:SRPBCC family protein [Bdellovibrionota bacterium]